MNEIVTDGQLARVVDRERPRVLRDRRDRGQRHELALVRADVEQRERRRVGLELGRELHDHLVLVGRRVDRRDLPRAVGGVERVLDLPGVETPSGGGLVAVDGDVDLRVLSCRSLVTSWSPAMPRIFCSSCGANW